MAPSLHKATQTDIPFIIEGIIAAEKSGTNNCGLQRVFNLNEHDLRLLLKKALLQETKGSELSLDSFWLLRKDDDAVGCLAIWPEESKLNSSKIKAALLGMFLNKSQLEYSKQWGDVVYEIGIPRSIGLLQIEYVYVAPEFHGQGYGGQMIKMALKRLKELFPRIKDCEIQVFGGNLGAFRLYEKLGFNEKVRKVGESKSLNNLFPSATKIMMQYQFHSQDAIS